MIEKILKHGTLKKILEAAILLAALVLGWQFHWDIGNFAFFMLFLVLIIHPVSSRWAAAGVIVMLLTTVAFLIFSQKDPAETAAIWAYYLMIMTAMLIMGEMNDGEEKNRREEI